MSLYKDDVKSDITFLFFVINQHRYKRKMEHYSSHLLEDFESKYQNRLIEIKNKYFNDNQLNEDDYFEVIG